MSKTCAECGAKCCTYFCFEIDEPTDYDEFEDIRWFLMHHDVTVHVDDGDWFIAIGNRCRMLGLDNACTAYETRPTICRKYAPATCDYTSGEYGYDEEFTTAEEIEAYARRALGPAKFDRARAKVWGSTSKKKNKRRKGKRTR
jgi:Fe-S-cluster containining protein